MKKLAATLVAAGMAFAFISVADAGSTINPTIPATNAQLNSAPIRSNFQAAFNDINNILGVFEGTSPPSNPTNLQSWANSSGFPVIVFDYFNGQTAQWIPYAKLNVTTGVYQPVAGAGITVTAPLVNTVVGGLPTLSLSYSTSFSVSGGQLVLNPPSASILGGVESLTCGSHQWLSQISTAGIPACSQPSFADISGTAAATQGGTGAASPSAHAVAVAEGSSPFDFIPTGIAGRLFIDQGTGIDPAFEMMSGDATLAASGAITLATVNANTGTFGSATQVPQVTFDAKGRATGVSNVTITHGSLDLQISQNLADLANAATARTNLGLGSVATQNANSVAITGGAVNGTTIGATTPEPITTTVLTDTGLSPGLLSAASGGGIENPTISAPLSFFGNALSIALATNSAPGAMQCDGTTISCPGGVASVVNGGAGRTRLTANLTLFINPSTGSDSNNCLTAGTACATFQHAYNIAANNYDMAGFTITLSNSTGAAYVGQLTLFGGYIGASAGPAIIIDNGGGKFSNGSGSCIATAGNYGFYQIQNISFTGVGGCNGYDVLNQVPAFVEVGTGVTLGNASTAQLGSVSSGATIQIGTSLTIAGSSLAAFAADQGGTILGTDAASVVTITGNPSISVFASANGLGTIQTLNFTFSGSVTGQRYNSSNNSIIQTSGGGANYFPGTAAGATSAGGIYQ